METKKYFCDEWELSSIRREETTSRVNALMERFRKFEDVLEALELPITDAHLFAGEYGVFVNIVFEEDEKWRFVTNFEVISAYLKAHLPMRNCDDLEILKSDYCLEYELDLNNYDFEYPSHDYFYMSLNS